MTEQQRHTTIDKSTRFSLAVIAALVMMAASVTWQGARIYTSNEVRWTKTEAQLVGLGERMDRLDSTVRSANDDRYRGEDAARDMHRVRKEHEQWIDHFGDLNPDLKVPKLAPE